MMRESTLLMLTLKFFFLIFRNTVEMQIKQDLAQQGTRGVRKFVGPVTVAVQVKTYPVYLENFILQ